MLAERSRAEGGASRVATNRNSSRQQLLRSLLPPSAGALVVEPETARTRELKRGSRRVLFVIMSLTEILDELPRLTHEERRLLCRRALALDEADDVAVIEHTAAEGFAVLDRMEAEDDARGKGK